MQKDLFVINTISKDLKIDHSELLNEHGLTWVFEPIEELNLPIDVYNTLVCAIVFRYHPESRKVDLKHDGKSIHEFILNGLQANRKHEIYDKFVSLENEHINEARGNFLDTLSGAWEFITIQSSIDAHSKTMRLSDEFPNLLDDEKKLKAKTELSKLRRDTILQRQTADSLIEKLRKEYVITDESVKTDYGVSFVDENIKKDIMSWRAFVKYDLPRLKEQNHMKNKTNV